MASTKITDGDEARFQNNVSKMKLCIERGDVAGAARHAESALEIRASEKLSKKLAKLRPGEYKDGVVHMEDVFHVEACEQAYLDDMSDDMVDLSNGLFVQKAVAQKLYAYQKEGLLWLWKLHQDGKGGILGDDMGLGKTVQVITFLCTLFDLNQIKTVLIVMPVTLIANWKLEFKKWADDLDIYDLHKSTKLQREDIIQRVQNRGGIVLLTYGLLVSNHNLLSQDVHRCGRSFMWDYMILDEGQKIKNPTKCTQGANAIPSNHRIVLSGTPIQNNLMELWSLFDFAHQGTLLGTRATFKASFDVPIKHSREKTATVGQKLLGNEMAMLLRKKIEPYFLRRLKSDVIKTNKTENDGDHLRPESLKRKNDLVVWIRLTEVQLRIYKDFLERDEVQEVLRTKKSPLMQLNILKKICDHPRLMTAENCEVFGLDEDETHSNGSKVGYTHVSNEQLLQESGKLKFLILLLRNLACEGHRTLVFSRTRCILNIAERLLDEHGIRFLRIDGTVKPSERQEIINKFNLRSHYNIMLLTTQVGGEGLTITAANRVVIFDPGWNPAQDEQAVDRCYRIGQKKAVIVYRLMTCGTVEEKIYRRQIFKQSIHKQMLQDDSNPYRYFGKQELYDLFDLEDPERSSTQIQLETMHGEQRRSDADLDHHIATLHSFGIFGISDHDLLFTISAGDEATCDAKQRQFISATVKRAEDQVSIESNMTRLAIVSGAPRVAASVAPTATMSPPVTGSKKWPVPASNSVIPVFHKPESPNEHDESMRLDDSLVVDVTRDSVPNGVHKLSRSVADNNVIVLSDTEDDGQEKPKDEANTSANRSIDCRSVSPSDNRLNSTMREQDGSLTSQTADSYMDVSHVAETDIDGSDSAADCAELETARKLRRSSMLVSLKKKVIDDENEDDSGEDDHEQIELIAENSLDSSSGTESSDSSSEDSSYSSNTRWRTPRGVHNNRRIIDSDTD